MSYVQEAYDDVWRTRTVVQTSSSSTQLFRISNLVDDDVEVRERWTPTPGCRACESAHANKHLVRCEARGYEYRLKYGRNPPATTAREYHESEIVPEGQHMVRAKRILCLILKESHHCHPNHRVNLHRPRHHAHTCETIAFCKENHKFQSDGGRQTQSQNPESSVTTHVPSQFLELSDMSARVRVNMKQRPLESQKQRRVMKVLMKMRS